MKTVILPPSTTGKTPTPHNLRQTRLYTLLGGNGSGKSLFLREIMRLNADDAYGISAVTDGMPSSMSGSLVQLVYNIAAEENAPKFSTLKEIWEETFPGNRISLSAGKTVSFTNKSGSDTISYPLLSRGEKAALYYIAAALSAPEGALVLVDSPTLFVHPTAVDRLWEQIENARRDCRFIYDTNDANFASGHTRRTAIWIQDYNAGNHTWHYQIIENGELPDELFLQMMGSRRPILFTEGDSTHSIDMRLYSVVFPELTIKPLGSCDKVIESTRSMQSLRAMHHIDSYGLVDRDRRSDAEVEYLRAKNILVPEVAEVENIFLASGVVSTMAEIRGRNSKKIVKAVRQEVMQKFEEMLDAQALQHTRHRMKRDVERKIDARFTCITALELHIKSLIKKLKPRENYEQLRTQFQKMIEGGNYEGVLRVFNHKPLLTNSCAWRMLGYHNHEEYINGVISAMRPDTDNAQRLRTEIRKLFT